MNDQKTKVLRLCTVVCSLWCMFTLLSVVKAAPQADRLRPGAPGTNPLDAMDKFHQGLSQAQLHKRLKALTKDCVVEGNLAKFSYAGVALYCISDARADRMRILSPITDQKNVTTVQTKAIMEANFHSALDARYATRNGTLYAVYIHPLSPTTDQQLKSAIAQVVSLVKTFGTTYSSGEIIFGDGGTNHQQKSL